MISNNYAENFSREMGLFFPHPVGAVPPVTADGGGQLGRSLAAEATFAYDTGRLNDINLYVLTVCGRCGYIQIKNANNNIV